MKKHDAFNFRSLKVMFDGEEINDIAEEQDICAVLDSKIRIGDKVTGRIAHGSNLSLVEGSHVVNHIEFIDRLMNSKSIKKILEEDDFDECEYEV